MFGHASSRQKPRRQFADCTCEKCRAMRREYMPTPGQALLFVAVALPMMWGLVAGAFCLAAQ
ncbi:MAG TPA: hypothetical protein VFF89_08600 [Sphingobium sp.]|nr:hypothetical protein [Sphingobium sp.]